MLQVKLHEVYYYDSMGAHDTTYLHTICKKAVDYVTIEMGGRGWISKKNLEVRFILSAAMKVCII